MNEAQTQTHYTAPSNLHVQFEHPGCSEAELKIMTADIRAFAEWIADDKKTRLWMNFDDAIRQYQSTSWRNAREGQRVRIPGEHWLAVVHVSRLGRRILFDTKNGFEAFKKQEDQIFRAVGSTGTDAATGRHWIFI